MAKTEIQGFLLRVSNIETVGEKQVQKQSILIKVPGYVDRFGERKTDDEIWQIDLFNRAIDKFNLHTRHQGQKVKAVVYINSRPYETKDGRKGFLLNANLGSLDFLESQRTMVTQDLSNAAAGDDDLPF
jgi:hypothetical protein